MCHQVIQVFNCGHKSSPNVVRCKKVTSDCVFPEPRMEDVKALCQPCGRAAARREAKKAQAAKALNQGYWR
ncbi:hypothetical protein VTL71DRAFT_9121 [Oculimacula yallundae]|uniref:Uncharacterized protein n=1 Tax=Oculimacula yallundae TaxID=86028 RepID=A0ABR4BVI1_9HELO